MHGQRTATFGWPFLHGPLVAFCAAGMPVILAALLRQ